MTYRCKGVRTAGATLALAMLKLRGRKYLFAPAIICQVYLLVDSQSSFDSTLEQSLSLYSVLHIDIMPE